MQVGDEVVVRRAVLWAQSTPISRTATSNMASFRSMPSEVQQLIFSKMRPEEWRACIEVSCGWRVEALAHLCNQQVYERVLRRYVRALV